MKTIIYTLLLTILCFSVKGQSTIITMRGDSLSGTYEIGKRGDSEIVELVEANGKKRKLKLFDVKYIRTADSEIIEPIKLENRYTFGKLISRGYLSLYAIKGEYSKSGFGEKVLVKLDGTSAVVPGALGFRKAMSRFLSDCPEVSQKIRDKKLSKNDLDTIIEQFNTCITGASASLKPTSAIPTVSPALDATDSEEVQTQINDFKTLLKYSEKVENKEDVSDMFNDLTEKVSAGKPVPNYLRKLLLSAVNRDDKLKKIVESLLK